MERKDYILKEIEKIGLLLDAIKQKFCGSKNNTSTRIEKQADKFKEQLLNELDFNLDEFLLLNEDKTIKYISRFEGFDLENIEKLAELISQIGFNDTSDTSPQYLQKALQLYEICNQKSRTYSIEREMNITAIKEALQQLDFINKTQ